MPTKGKKAYSLCKVQRRNRSLRATMG